MGKQKLLLSLSPLQHLVDNKAAHISSANGKFQLKLDIHFKLCIVTSALVIRCSDDVVVQWFSRVGLLIDEVFRGGAGHPWNVRQATWGGLSHWGATTLQQELSVVNDPGTAGGRAKQCSSRSSAVVVGHVLCVVDSHPSGRWNGLGGTGLLAARRHLRLL